LFRVVQESLTNVLRHSGSKKASVGLSLGKTFMQVSISDQGTGIPARTLHNINSGKGRLGVGLPGMRERIKQLDGTMEIISGKHGTEIVATVPLQEGELLAAEPSAVAAQPTARRKRAEAEKVGTGRKRIIIADDHEVARLSLKTLLANDPDLEVIGEAKNGAEAVMQVELLRPDLLIVDLIMPRMGGFAAIHRLHEMGIDCKILVFTTHFYPQLDRSLRATRCDGYVLKSNIGTDLLRAIRCVLAGEKFFPRRKSCGAD
jgi:CheY-like chemotaxis protein